MAFRDCANASENSRARSPCTATETVYHLDRFAGTHAKPAAATNIVTASLHLAQRPETIMIVVMFVVFTLLASSAGETHHWGYAH
jgi:hypothetical protein